MLVRMLSSPTPQENELGNPSQRNTFFKKLRLEYKQIFYFKVTKDLCVPDPMPSALPIAASLMSPPASGHLLNPVPAVLSLPGCFLPFRFQRRGFLHCVVHWLPTWSVILLPLSVILCHIAFLPSALLTRVHRDLGRAWLGCHCSNFFN